MVESSLEARFAAAGLDWIVPRWDVAPSVRAFVTTRCGGVSTQSYATMNVGGVHPESDGGDDPSAIARNRARLQTYTPTAPLWLEQVHGTNVVTLDATNVELVRAQPPAADAAVTRNADVVLAVRAADCLPVLLADRAGSIVAAAHAGWRGLAAGVLEATIESMGMAPSALVAWLGPAIGPTAFEVGTDVHAAFCAADPHAEQAFVALGNGKWLADLYALARLRLARAGVGAVSGGGWCTYNERERFYSYRRERAKGRMAAVIWRDVASG